MDVLYVPETNASSVLFTRVNIRCLTNHPTLCASLPLDIAARASLILPPSHDICLVHDLTTQNLYMLNLALCSDAHVETAESKRRSLVTTGNGCSTVGDTTTTGGEIDVAEDTTVAEDCTTEVCSYDTDIVMPTKQRAGHTAAAQGPKALTFLMKSETERLTLDMCVMNTGFFFLYSAARAKTGDVDVIVYSDDHSITRKVTDVENDDTASQKKSQKETCSFFLLVPEECYASGDAMYTVVKATGSSEYDFTCPYMLIKSDRERIVFSFRLDGDLVCMSRLLSPAQGSTRFALATDHTREPSQCVFI